MLVQVGAIHLSRIMQNLSFRHTRRINARLKSTRHLFQGRYKAILVDGDNYLLQLVSCRIGYGRQSRCKHPELGRETVKEKIVEVWGCDEEDGVVERGSGKSCTLAGPAFTDLKRNGIERNEKSRSACLNTCKKDGNICWN